MITVSPTIDDLTLTEFIIDKNQQLIIPSRDVQLLDQDIVVIAHSRK